MNRYFIALQYDGTHYHGWQIQQNANSVQAEVEKALSTLLQQEITTTGAGRTDAGVHAKQFFAHFDTNISININQVKYKLNNILPVDIACYNVIKVIQDAHARFSATSRTYEYLITQTKHPFLINKAWYYPHSLNVELMNIAAEELKNHTDFSCFCKSKSESYTNECKILESFWVINNNELKFTITANRFLRNMVRAIVGTLLEIGKEKISLEDFKKIIQSKNRSNAGSSVPAHGLYLTKITYQKEVFHG